MKLVLLCLLTLAACDAKDPGISSETAIFFIQFSLPDSAIVTMTIEDSYSNDVKHIIANQNLPSGIYRFQWDRTDIHNSKVPKGLYFVRIRYSDRSGKSEEIREIILS